MRAHTEIYVGVRRDEIRKHPACVIMTLKRGVLHGADCSLHTQCVCHYDTGKIDVDCETGPVWRLSPVAGGSSLLTYHHPGQARVLTCGQNRERES